MCLCKSTPIQFMNMVHFWLQKTKKLHGGIKKAKTLLLNACFILLWFLPLSFLLLTYPPTQAQVVKTPVVYAYPMRWRCPSQDIFNLKLNIFCCYCLFPKNYAASESSKVLCFVQVFHCNFIFSGVFCIQANLTLCLVFWHDNNCALHWRVVLFLQVWLHRSSPSI